MPNNNPYDFGYLQYVDLINEIGTKTAVAEYLGIPRTTFIDSFNRTKDEFFKASTLITPIKIVPDKKLTKKFIFTSAQAGTKVHQEFLRNLEAYADFLKAEIFISGFSYNMKIDPDNIEPYFETEIQQYISRDRLEIGPNLVYCGESNTLPTAVMPLSGFETYTRRQSGIFPHAKVQLRSIATMKNEPSKILATTGCITLPNYVAKKAGQKAEFHHILGATVVELLSDGSFFFRHLIADRDGAFQDLTYRVEKGKVADGFAVEAITHGDIHFEEIDNDVFNVVWGKNGLVDSLQPKYQFFHDTLNFDSRGYHRIADPHHQYMLYVEGKDDISKSMKEIGSFLEATCRPFSKSIVIESNHDRHYLQWLKTADYKTDHVNAELFLWAQLETYKAIKEKNKRFMLFEHTLKHFTPTLEKQVQFLKEDDSFLICGDGSTGIECGLHGHLGSNGSRGSVKGYTHMGPRTNTAHTHAPTIIDGAYCAGTYSKLDLGYNRGPSSWGHAAIVTYPNGKRTMISFSNGKWRA